MPSCEVEVDTLDHVVKCLCPVLMKIDVEGFETEVVAGANDVLSNKALLAVIMELNGSGRRYDYDEDELYTRMIKYGFAPVLTTLINVPGRVDREEFRIRQHAIRERCRRGETAFAVGAAFHGLGREFVKAILSNRWKVEFCG
jgi:hypothetical protein